MDAKQPHLTVVYAPTTRPELNKIRKYNDKAHGSKHAASPRTD